jgi:hypothetical protein
LKCTFKKPLLKMGRISVGCANVTVEVEIMWVQDSKFSSKPS